METKTASNTKAEAPGVAGVGERLGLIQWAATRFGEVDAGKVMGILRATCFRVGAQDEPATDAEVAALLIVARTYDLNPFTKEIFAFKDKHKGIVPIVSIDGWVKLVNRDPHFDGVEFIEGNQVVAEHGGKKAFDKITCKMYVKGRVKPVEVTEYLDEVYQAPRGQNQTHGPWQTHPKRMHRHKAYIQCGRLAFGFGGIYDEDEAERIIGSGAAEIVLQGGPTSDSTAVSTERVERKEGELEPARTRTSSLAKDLKKQAQSAEDATMVEGAPAHAGMAAAEAALREEVENRAAPEKTPEPQVTVTPTIESVGKDIAAAGSLEDLNKILLDKVMKLTGSPQRDELMQEWNKRVTALTGVATAAAPAAEKPKPSARKQQGKQAGTPEQLDDIVNGMDIATTMDQLNLHSDVARGYLWSPAQQQLLNDKYAERQKALSAK